MDEFPGNSRTSKRELPNERPKVEKVVTGQVRKKSVGRRIIETFFGSSDAKGVGQYLVENVVVPMTKDLIADVFIQGVERTLYQDNTPGRSSSLRSRSSSNYVPYNRYTQGSGPAGMRIDEPSRQMSRQGRATHNFNELEYNHRHEAEEVLGIMISRIKQYGVVTVADFYEASGVSGQFVDENWGWHDLSEAGIVRIRGGGYVIKLPPATDQL